MDHIINLTLTCKSIKYWKILENILIRKDICVFIHIKIY